MIHPNEGQRRSNGQNWNEEGRYPAPQPQPTPGQEVSPRPVTLDLRHHMHEDVIDSPMSGEENFLGSLKRILMKNRGQEIVASFLIGNAAPVSWQGTLFEVGNDYIVIHQEMYGRYIVGDLLALKFVEFPNEKNNPFAGYRQRDGATIW